MANYTLKLVNNPTSTTALAIFLNYPLEQIPAIPFPIMSYQSRKTLTRVILNHI